RLVVGRGGGVIVREIAAEQLVHRREVIAGLRGVARQLRLHRLVGGDGARAILGGRGAGGSHRRHHEQSEQVQGSTDHWRSLLWVARVGVLASYTGRTGEVKRQAEHSRSQRTPLANSLSLMKRQPARSAAPRSSLAPEMPRMLPTIT